METSALFIADYFLNFVASLRGSGINGNMFFDLFAVCKFVTVASLRGSGINGNPACRRAAAAAGRESLPFGEAELMETSCKALPLKPLSASLPFGEAELMETALIASQ